MASLPIGWQIRRILPIVALAALMSVAAFVCSCDSHAQGSSPVTSGDGLLRWGRWRATPGNFVYPRGIAVFGPDTVDDASRLIVAVVDKTQRLQVFSGTGTLLREVGLHLPRLDGSDGADGSGINKGFPVGLGMHPLDGRIFLANTHYSEIVTFDVAGKEVMRHGSYGSGMGEFVYPVRVAVRPDGGYYVSEYGYNQHRIQQFSADHKPLRMFGEYGSGPGQFDRPNGICLDGEGFLYVCDANNHRIQKFTPDGRLVAILGRPGDSPGELRVPYGICYDATSDRLIIAEFTGSRLTMMRRDGTPLGRYFAADLAHPWDVCCSGHFAFVPDYRHHGVVRIPLANLPNEPTGPPVMKRFD